MLTCSTQTDRMTMWVYVKLWMYVQSRSTSFFSWCLTQSLVRDSGQPFIVCQHDQLTDDTTEYARWAELLDLPVMCRRPHSSTTSKSVEYSIKKVLISTISSTSSGRLLKFYNKHIAYSVWLFTLTKLYKLTFSFFSWCLRQWLVCQPVTEWRMGL